MKFRIVIALIRKLHRAFGRIQERIFNPASIIQRFGNSPPQLVAVVIAHPDDEAFCSGFLRWCVEQGSRVIIISATRGEGARSQMPNLAMVRSQELADSAEILGVSQVLHLDVPNRPLTVRTPETNRSDFELLMAGLGKTLTAIKPCLLITHGTDGEYGHPDHLMLNRAVRTLARESGIRVLLFNSWNRNSRLKQLLNASDAPDFELCCLPYADVRMASLKAHLSQREVFEAFAQGDLQVFIDQSSIERYRDL